ncbi:hypothetical protein JCM3765_002041 [Sporobolomyces pararoseus]
MYRPVPPPPTSPPRWSRFPRQYSTSVSGQLGVPRTLPVPLQSAPFDLNDLEAKLRYSKGMSEAAKAAWTTPAIIESLKSKKREGLADDDSRRGEGATSKNGGSSSEGRQAGGGVFGKVRAGDVHVAANASDGRIGQGTSSAAHRPPHHPLSQSQSQSQSRSHSHSYPQSHSNPQPPRFQPAVQLPDDFPEGFQVNPDDIEAAELNEIDFDRIEIDDLDDVTVERVRWLLEDAERTGRKLVVILWWWDSKLKEWVQVQITLPFLRRWAQRLLRRDLKLQPDQYELHSTVVFGSAVTPHINLDHHVGFPDNLSFEHCHKKLLAKADIILAVGERGLGYNIESLKSTVLSKVKDQAIIITTRVGGTISSLYLEPRILEEKIQDELERLGVSVDQQEGMVVPTDDLWGHSLRYMKEPFSNEDIAEDPEGFVVYTMVTGFVSRKMSGLATKVGNLTGGRHRFPQLAEMSGVQEKKSNSGNVRHERTQPKVKNTMAQTVPAPNANGNKICTNKGCPNEWTISRWKICDSCNSRRQAPLAQGVSNDVQSGPKRKQPSTPRETKSAPESDSGSDSDEDLTQRGTKRQRGTHRCDECDHPFNSQANLDAHVVRGCYSFSCDHPGCDEAFGSHDRLLRHRNVAHRQAEKSKKRCDRDGCDKTFRLATELPRHLAWHDEPDASATLRCDECQKLWKDAKGRREHMRKVHDASGGF